MNIIHGDLACRNLLVDEHDDVFVADFGLARAKKKSKAEDKEKNVPCPLLWAAPECLRAPKSKIMHCVLFGESFFPVNFLLLKDMLFLLSLIKAINMLKHPIFIVLECACTKSFSVWK